MRDKKDADAARLHKMDEIRPQFARARIVLRALRCVRLRWPLWRASPRGSATTRAHARSRPSGERLHTYAFLPLTHTRPRHGSVAHVRREKKSDIGLINTSLRTLSRPATPRAIVRVASKKSPIGNSPRDRNRSRALLEGHAPRKPPQRKKRRAPNTGTRRKRRERRSVRNYAAAILSSPGLRST